MSNEDVKHEGMEHKYLEDKIDEYVDVQRDLLNEHIEHLTQYERLEFKIDALFAICLKIDARSMWHMYGDEEDVGKF